MRIELGLRYLRRRWFLECEVGDGVPTRQEYDKIVAIATEPLASLRESAASLLERHNKWLLRFKRITVD